MNYLKKPLTASPFRNICWICSNTRWKNRRIRRRIPRAARIVIAVILAVAICSGTVLSYRYLSERYDSHFENITHEDIDSGRVVANGATSICGNLAITVNAVTGDARIAYFDITAKAWTEPHCCGNSRPDLR